MAMETFEVTPDQQIPRVYTVFSNFFLPTVKTESGTVQDDFIAETTTTAAAAAGGAAEKKRPVSPVKTYPAVNGRPNEIRTCEHCAYCGHVAPSETFYKFCTATKRFCSVDCHHRYSASHQVRRRYECGLSICRLLWRSLDPWSWSKLMALMKKKSGIFKSSQAIWSLQLET